MKNDTSGKMPIGFAWDEEAGKYETFPYDLLETFKDKKQGFSYPLLKYRGGNNKKRDEKLCVIAKYPHCFDFDGHRYTLKDIPGLTKRAKLNALERSRLTNQRLNRRAGELTNMVTLAQKELNLLLMAQPQLRARWEAEQYHVRNDQLWTDMQGRLLAGIILLTAYGVIVTMILIARIHGWG